VNGASSRRWLAVAALAAALLAVVFVVRAVFHDGTPSDVDCATFRVTPDLWSRAAYDRRIQLQRGLLDCKTLDGRPDTEVVSILGPPDRNAAHEIDYFLPYGQGSTDRQVWRIHLGADHRVTGSTTDTP
jgi:hypothetical protein